MKIVKRISICLLLTAVFSLNTKAQLNGTYNVPATYTSIAAAISALNTVGISGSVTINIAAGYTETAPVGGFSLTATGNSTASITFQKSGAGANPLITAYTGGTGTPGTAVQDGIWRLIGCDYVTIDGIDLYDPNTTNPATMEFGYALLRMAPFNGCQYNTIKNCTITLNRVNNATGAAPVYHGSRGIDVCNSSSSAQSTNMTITTAAGSNSYNKFYSNTIQNCNTGISLVGFATISPFVLADQFNDVGGSSAATGNTILNFGGGGATNPAVGIRTRYQYNVNVSFNVVNNNNGSGVDHTTTLRGIQFDLADQANGSILNNTVTVHGGGTTSQLTAIHNLAGTASLTNTIAINNNVITNCSYSTATTGGFSGIWNEVATPGYLQINGNTFLNNSYGGAGGSVIFINNNGVVASGLDISNNIINSTSFTASNTAAGMSGILSTQAGSVCSQSVNNNTLQGVSSNTMTGQITFITMQSGSSLQLLGNVMSNTTFSTTGNVTFMNNNCQCNSLVSNNSFIGTLAKTGNGGTFSGYICSVATPDSYTITNNNFSNVTLNGAAFMGIQNTVSSGSVSIVNSNTITNISGAGGAGSAGIYQSGGGPGSTISNNIVSSMSVTALVHGIYNGVGLGNGVTVSSNTVSNLYSTAASTVFGMYHNFGSSVNIYQNKIYDLQVNNAAGVVVGLGVPGSTASNTVNIFNNLIGDLRAPIANNANAIIGINLNSTATNAFMNVYYNSIYINASSTGVNFGTSGVHHTASTTSTTAQLDLRNNIIVNSSTANGTGLTVACRRTATTQANYNTTSNTNIFYGGTPGTKNLLYYDGTNSIQTMSSYKTLVTPREISSATEFPPFLSVVGSNANFLNLNTTTPTQAESAATPITGITTDFAGTTRNASTPDIGAWEGNFTPADLTPPAITAVGYLNATCNLSTRTVTANIQDVSGVATGSLAPRCYYKVNAGAYTSVQGTLASGTINNGVWNFVLTYAAAVGDVISHYITAQDASSAANVGATPSAGFSATDVNNVVAPPNTPNTYTITGTLNGTYTVGTAGTFTTLTAAAAAYNTWCITGPVTFVLTNTTYTAGETFPIIFMNSVYASATNSLLIIPAAANAATITGTAASAAVLKFQNAQYITVDGLNSGGSSLAIINSNTGTSAAIWMASTTGIGPGCKNLEFSNLNIRGNSTTVLSNYGIVASVDGASPSTTGGMDNDNVIVQNNTFLRTGNAIYATGSTSLSAGGLNNWAINSNTIGPVATGTTVIGASGIALSGVVNATVMNNYIRNIVTGGSGIAAIDLSSLVNTVTVSQNTVSGVACSSTANGVNSVCGLFIGSGTGATISKNVFTSIYSTATGGAGARGIIINSGTSTMNAVLTNNFIGDIYSYSGTTAANWPMGIAIEGVSGGVDIDNNSISLSGAHAGLTSTTSAVAFYVSSLSGNIRLRNNILSNTYDNSNSNDRIYSIYSTVPASVFSAINYNDYYVGGTAASQILGFISATNQMNLAAIQSSFGSNLNSQNIQPVFTSASDLHLVPAMNAPIDNLAVPLAGILTDIDNQPRSSSTPDIGADEFTAPPCSSASGGTQGTATFTACSGQTLSLSSSGASTGAGITYQWQVATVSGGPYSNVTGGSGANTTTYNTGTLSAGTYYYVLQTTCTSASLTGTSNEATVTINPIPTASISSNSPVCVGQALNLFGGTNVGTAFAWNGPAGFTSNSQNPTFPSASLSNAGNYTLVVSVGSCSSSAVSAIAVNALPNPTVSSTPSVICVGDTPTLTASGGVNYSWTGPNSFSSALQNPVISNIQIVASGQYTVVVAGANSCTNSAVVTLTVSSLPAPSVFTSTSSICTGNSATLNASGGTTYSWTTGSTASVIVVSPTVTTGYTLTAYAGGCNASVPVTITVNSNPTVTAISSASILCTGSSVTLTANGANSYTWSSGTVSGTTVESPTATTVYTVTGEDMNGCMNSFVITQTVSTCAGIENSLAAEVSIYPNPSAGMLNISSPAGVLTALELMDATGRMVLKSVIVSEQNQIDISKLQSGIYFYVLKNKESVLLTGKLIKE